jgi:hypothetical protein
VLSSAAKCEARELSTRAVGTRYIDIGLRKSVPGRELPH